MEDTVALDSSQESEIQQSSLKRRLLYGDKKKFEKYVRSTSTHGVKHVFVGKSKIRRTFWAILLLFSLVGCVYGIISSIVQFSRVPTATTVYTDHVQRLTFPAVTICNLNGYRLSVLDENNLTEYVTASMLHRSEDTECGEATGFDTGEVLSSVVEKTSQPLNDLIIDCSFLGEPCDLDAMFTSYAVPTGTCYTFNERTPHFTVPGSGFRHSLQLVLNVQNEEYIGSPHSEAGILVSIHEQGAPALVWESGVAVPVGHSAYLSVTQNQIEDLTNREDFSDNNDCINNPLEFEFVQRYNYSYRACRLDCILVQMAKVCECNLDLDRTFSGTKMYRNCTIADLCCIFGIIDYAKECQCPVLCNHTSFDVTPSYSTFPSTIKAIRKYNFSSMDDAANNLLQMRVFFGDLSIHRETTVRSYSLAALISNIGGNMGIFLGASIISFTEFLTLIFDGIKDRLCGFREAKIKKLWSSHKLKNESPHKNSSTEFGVGGYSVYIDHSSMDSSPVSSNSSSEPLS